MGKGGSHFINHRRQLALGEAEGRARRGMNAALRGLSGEGQRSPSLPKPGSGKLISRWKKKRETRKMDKEKTTPVYIIPLSDRRIRFKFLFLY